MRYLASHEKKVRGTFDFPIELYYVDPSHSRYEMPFHWHMECELILVLQGEFSLSLESESFLLHAGEAVFIPGGMIHGGVPQNCMYECVVFDLERFLHDSAICRAKFEHILGQGENLQNYFSKSSPVCPILDALFEAMEKEQPGYEFITTGLLWQFIGIILQKRLYTAPHTNENQTTKRAQQMKNVLRRIRKDYAKPLTLEDLAAETTMAPKYFCRVFHQITGRTPINYLNYYRVECAAELLRSTDDSITEIAFACGFNDSCYFSKTFFRYKGVNPKEYRRKPL